MSSPAPSQLRFQVLSDDEKRSIYDRFGEAGLNGRGAPGAGGMGYGDFT